MAVEIYSLVIVCIGLLLNLVLFNRFPKLPARQKSTQTPTFSIIIPARDEEQNLACLLGDLQVQSLKPDEIICVDDDSSDGTAKIAESFGATLISLHDKPQGWTGKTWACQNGANLATGELLLFLDADVRLGVDGLARLVQAYKENNCTISVQPFHKTEKPYEQLSLLFNLIQIAANGTTLPWDSTLGLHGPVILIPKTDYDLIGGHETIRNVVVEDLALGHQLKKAHLPYKLFIGDENISYKMYSSGLVSLFQGWVKCIAGGASITSLLSLFMIFLWISSIAGSPYYLAQFAISGNLPMLLAHSGLYLLWVIILYLLAKKIGRFHLLYIVFFPILIISFLFLFIFSLIKRLLGLPVTWKGRVIAGEDKE